MGNCVKFLWLSWKTWALCTYNFSTFYSCLFKNVEKYHFDFIKITPLYSGWLWFYRANVLKDATVGHFFKSQRLVSSIFLWIFWPNQTILPFKIGKKNNDHYFSKFFHYHSIGLVFLVHFCQSKDIKFLMKC